MPWFPLIWEHEAIIQDTNLDEILIHPNWRFMYPLHTESQTEQKTYILIYTMQQTYKDRIMFSYKGWLTGLVWKKRKKVPTRPEDLQRQGNSLQKSIYWSCDLSVYIWHIY